MATRFRRPPWDSIERAWWFLIGTIEPIAELIDAYSRLRK